MFFFFLSLPTVWF